MQFPRDQLLARPTFAKNQNRRLRGSDQVDLLTNHLQRRTVANQFAKRRDIDFFAQDTRSLARAAA